MKKKIGLWLSGLTAAVLVGSLNAQEVLKDDNALPLNDPASWVGGAVPGDTNSAVWDATVLGDNTVDIGGALTWDGLRIANPGGAVTVNGTARLTLDGGAATDIDMSAATQDLTLNAPVTLGGSSVAAVNAGRALSLNGGLWSGSLTKNGDGRLVIGGTASLGNSVYAAGDTVWTAGGTSSGDNKLSGGNLTLKGNTLIMSGNTEALAVYNGTLVLDGGALSMTNANSRFFAGRTSGTSDGLVIVSNGTHSILGWNNNSMANFIGVSGAKRGRLFMEGGSLTVNYLRLATNNKSADDWTDELIINNGVLTAVATTDADPQSKAFKMGTRHDESTDVSSRSGRLELNGGRFSVPNGVSQISVDTAASTGKQEIFLNGGVWSVKKIAIGSAPSVVRNIYLNGGVLQGTNVAAGAELIDGAANAVFKVRARGAVIDSGAYSFGLTANLAEDGTSPGGGLVKLGSGTLTLGGAGSYTGDTVVSNGTLRLAGTLAATNLVVAPGASFSMADGALATFAPGSLSIGSVSLASGLTLEVAASGNSCDTIAVPAGAAFLKVAVTLVQQGSANPVVREGDFPILTFSGAAPSAAWLTWANPVTGLSCTFELDSASRTIYARLRVSGVPGQSVWINPAGGAWETAANWSAVPASAAGTRVLFGEIPAAATAVSLDTAFTVGQMVLSNANAYTLSGAGSLALDNGAATPSVTVGAGSHTLSLPVTPAAALTVNTLGSASLTANGAIGGASALVKQGSGELILTAANTYAGGTTVQGGTLSLQQDATLGTGAVSLSASGVRLRSAGAGPVTISNTVVAAASGAALDAIAPMTLLGTLDWAAGQQTVYKYGTGELTFKGTAAESGNYRLNLRTGTFRMAEGAGLLINNANARDSLWIADGTGSARTFTVETGAVVVAGGLYTGSGPSNTVHVNGGSLTLTGSGVSGENGLIRVTEDTNPNGTDRLIVDAGALTFSDDDWLSFGVRGGGAELIVNGGTATFGKFSLGVRADTGFGSTGYYTYSKVWVNGGVMDVAGALNWMADIREGRVNQVFLNGGTLRLPATLRSVALSIANRSELRLNGGTLVLRGLGNVGSTSLDNYLSGLNDLYVDQGGAVIDTLSNSATITQALQRVGSTTGGLTKRGSGTLTLSGACDVAGTTAVEAGTLRFGSTTATTGLIVSNSATLSLANGAYDTLSVAAATLADGARLNLEAASDSATCDRLALPADASVGRVVIGLYVSGTSTFVTRPDDYPVFSYAGTPPDVTGWSLAPEAFGVSATFVTNTANQTIDLRLAYNAGQSVWQNTGSGDWSVSGNWWPQAPAASGSTVLFGNAPLDSAAVNVDGAVSVAALIFDHTYSYALAGSAVTLDNGGGDASVSVLAGSHTLSNALTLSGGTLASVAAGAQLKVTDVASGAGGLTVTGGGQLTLDGTNMTPTTVSGGATVAVPDADALGGAALTLDGGTLAVAASDTLGGTVALGASGGTFRSGTGQTLLLDAAVTGDGGLTKAGAGTLTLGASADGYTGPTTSGGGTLSVAEVPAGALVFGRGTLAFTGTSGSSSQPVTIASGTNAAVLLAGGDLTLSGPVSTTSGAFFKSGSGAVSFTGATTNRLGAANAANMNGLAAAGVDGDGPSAGFGAFNVAQGRVTLGAEGQSNVIAGALLVGLSTTAAAGAETAGELVVAGGSTVCGDWTYVGRNNGNATTAPAGLASRLLVESGTFTTENLSLGGAAGFAGYTGRPVLEVQGGACTVRAVLYAGETLGGVSTLWVNGGTLRHLATTDTSIRLGNSGGEGVLRLSGGAAELAKDVILAYGGLGSTGTVELAGGMLTAQNIYKWTSPGTGYGRVLFNGGVFRPTGGGMSGIDSAKIGDGPAIFDTSLYTGNGYNLAQALSGVGGTDGGLVKAGTNALTINAAMAYNGPTVVSGGVLRVLGSLPAASALTVVPGARLALNNAAVKTVTVSALTLGDAVDTTPAQIEIGIDSGAKTNDQLVVTGALTAHHVAFSFFNLSSQTDFIVANGRYALIRYSGSDPDPAAFSVANPLPGKSYTFSVLGQTLYVDIGAATADAYVWASAGGGDWTETEKWVSAPGAGAAGAAVRFDTAITAASSVRLNQGATVGGLYFNSTNAYTLSSDGSSVIALDNGAGAATVQVEQGRHRVEAALTLQSDVNLKPISGTGLVLGGAISGAGDVVKQNGGELTLGGANTFDGDLRLTSGSLTLTNGATTGAGTLSLESNGSQVRASGATPSVLASDVALRYATNVVITVDPASRLEFTGELRYENPAYSLLNKQGGGELTLSGSANAPTDNARVNLQEGTLRFASGANVRLGNVNREIVKMDTDNSRLRTLAVDQGANVTLGGVYAAYGTNAVVVDGRLDFTGNSDAICLRLQSNAAEDRFTVRPTGVVTAPQAAWANIGVRGPAVFTVDGGSAQLGSVSLGYQNGGVSFYGVYGRVFVTGGGVLDVTGRFNWNGDNSLSRANNVFVGSGASSGTLRLPPTTNAHTVGWASLALDNGTLVTPGIGLASVVGEYLNGLRQLYVSRAGGTVDTAGQNVTVSLPVCSDTAGGSLAKAGAGTLTLAQPLRLDGAVDVRGGTLSAALAAAARQSLPSNLLARLNMENGPVADTSGNGRHGVLRGAAAMGAGTNGLYGLTFETGASSVCVPCDAEMRGMPSFTVAMWVWVNSVSAAAGTATTFFTTRKDNVSSGPYEFMLRMSNNKVRFTTTGNTTAWGSYDTTAAVPGSNQWFHLAYVVTPSGVSAFINGAAAGSSTLAVMKTTLFIPPTRPLNEYGFGFGHYHLAAPQVDQFKGRLDDVQVYSRALSQAEVQALMTTEPVLPDLRVAGGALFAAQGAAEVDELTGEGYVSGAVTVRGSVAPGDTTNAWAGAVLMAENLTFAAGSVYKWTWTPELSDELRVGSLTIAGAGVLDFGRDESDPVKGPFETVLMRYDMIAGAPNFASWTFENAGCRGFDASIRAENGEVVLRFLSTRGTLLFLK